VNGIRGYETLEGLAPSGTGSAQFLIAKQHIEHFKVDGPEFKYWELLSASETLKEPLIIAEGLKRDGFEGALCYIAKPRKYGDGWNAPPPPRMVFLVCMTHHYKMRLNHHSSKLTENASGGDMAAFSLVELLTVIAIIGILAALLLNSVSHAKQRAYRIQCINNLHQMGSSLQIFLADNHGYPVMFTSTNKNYPASDRFWLGQLEREGFGISRPATNFYLNGVWYCPSTQWSASMQRGMRGTDAGASYGYNDDRWKPNLQPINPTNQFGLQGHYDPTTLTFRPITESEVAVPSDMMAIGDCFEANALFLRRNLMDLEGFGNTLTRHQGKANVVFCDGHVESPTLNFLFVDTNSAALVRWNRDHQPHPENL